MKICLVSDYLAEYHEKWSGAEMVAKILAELLLKENQAVFFFTSKFPKNPDRNKISNGARETVFQIPILTNRGGLLKKILIPFYLFWGIFFSVYCLNKVKPEVINFLHTNYLFLPVMLAAKILRIPTVFTFLDYYMICDRATFLLPNGEICDQLEGKVCQRCISKTKMLERYFIKLLRGKIDGIITFTETSKQRLIRHRFPPEKIRVIYTYTIPEKFKGKTREKKPNSVLVTAFFRPHKGLDIVLQAWPKVISEIPEAKLTVVGSGNKEDNTRIADLVDNLKIKNSVKFLGQKENEAVLNLILEQEVVIVPEQWPSEFGPLALVEALALGTPVVASKIGSASDFIQDDINGFLVEPNQPLQFAEKIIHLLKNKEEARLMGEKAKTAGKILFSYNQGRDTLNFYKELIKA